MPRYKSFSHFFITVNSNEDLSNDPERLQLFKAGCEFMFFKRIGQYLKFNQSRTTDSGNVTDYIDGAVDVELAFEHGEDKNRDHCHATINIEHNTRLLIDQKNMREFFCNMMGHKIHLNIRPGTNQEKTLSAYLNKQSQTIKRQVSV